MTLTEYKKSAFGVQVFIFAFPLVSKIFDHHSPVPFPPIGDDSTPWRFFAVLIIGVSGVLPYFLLPVKWRRPVIGCLFALFLISSAIYLNKNSTYVVPVPRANGTIRYVTRGTARNPALREPYASMSDTDLVRNSGQSDSDLEHAYTKESLRANRQTLFWWYVLSLMLLEFIVGSFAMSDRSTHHP